MRRIDRFFIAIVLALGATTVPARADFYRLDGRFECLGRPDAVCFDKTPASADPYAPAAAPPSDSVHERARPSSPSAVAAPTTHAASRPLDPILAIAARVKREHPDPDDLGDLHRAAAAGDARAVELLAWCALRGIGTGRDPMQAYLLYGKAADLSVPHARENQALVYERSLSSAEREHILEMEAAQHPVPGLMSDADGAARHVP
jgi:TPR repeat protein